MDIENPTQQSEVGDLYSRYELAKNDIMNEFASISTDNGYRNNIASVVRALRHPDNINQFPEIGVVVPQMSVKGLDSGWSSFDTICDVFVQGVVSAKDSMKVDQLELQASVDSLASDMQRVVGELMTKYINTFQGDGIDRRWNILPSAIRISTFTDFGQKQNKGVVLVEFQIQLRSMDKTFR
jgi:hypothetical protein